MLRWLAGLGVLSLLSLVAVSAHWYVIQRMIVDPGVSAPWAGLASALVWAGFASMLLQPIGERVLPRRIAR